MGTKLKVFRLNENPKVSPVLDSTVVVTATGDAARQEARSYLESSGMVLRSLNWGPGDPGKPDLLIAYVKPQKG